MRRGNADKIGARSAQQGEGQRRKERKEGGNGGRRARTCLRAFGVIETKLFPRRFISRAKLSTRLVSLGFRRG